MSFSSRKVPEGLYHRLLECARLRPALREPGPDLRVADRRVSRGGLRERRGGSVRRRDLREGRRERSLRSFPTCGERPTSARGTARFWSDCETAGFEETVGFEPSEAPLAAAPASVRDAIRPEPFSAGVLPDESFTLISCMQTIEHVLDPLDVCRDAVRALAPRGAVLIVCHDRTSVHGAQSSSSARRSSTSSTSSSSRHGA